MLPTVRSLAFFLALGLCAAFAQAQTIATGARHGLALQADGTVLAWGDNRLGQLGLGGAPQGNTDQVIPLPSRAVAVKSSAAHALVLDEDGNVWSWGTNRKGQLGDGTLADRATPQVIFRNAAKIVFNGGDLYPSTLIDKDGQPWWWGPLPSGEVLASPAQAASIPGRLVSLVHAGFTAAGLDDQGVVWTWGEGAACTPSAVVSGPVAMRGVPPIRRFVLTDQTSANMSGRSPAHSLVYAQDRDGRYWKWGSEFVTGGFEGYWPEWKAFCPPVQSPDAQPMLDATYTGPDELRSAGVVLSHIADSGLRAIQASQQSFHLGWTADGDLWLWVGAGSGSNASVVRKHASGVVDAAPYSGVFQGGGAVASTAYQPGLMYITRDGLLHVRGSNANLHLGIARRDVDSASSPQKVPLPAAAASVHAQGAGSYALLKDGRVFRWGYETTPFDAQANISWPARAAGPVPIDAPASLVKLAVSNGRWIGLDARGNVWTIDSPQLGSGRPNRIVRPTRVTRTKGMPAARDIAASTGSDLGLVLGVDGTVWRLDPWARLLTPDEGPVGDEVSTPVFVPVQFGGLPPSVTQVATAGPGNFALDGAGDVWYWGSNAYGLGGPAVQPGDGYVKAPFVLPLPGKAVSIHAGLFNFCAVLGDGSAFCRGRMFDAAQGRRFQLHAPIREVVISPDGETAGTVLLRLADGTVWAWGRGQSGQLGAGIYANAAEPLPVIDESGTADLDLDPAAPNVATASRPPFRVQTRLAGNLRSLSFNADVFGSAASGSGNLNIYAFATADLRTWMQLDGLAQWSALRSPVPAAASKVPLAGEGQSVPLTLLPQFVGTGLAGLRLFVGQGRDAQEMLSARRFREVLELAPED